MQRFQQVKPGWFIDKQTKLVWSYTQNEVSWIRAQDICRKSREPIRLPSEEELMTLYDASKHQAFLEEMHNKTFWTNSTLLCAEDDANCVEFTSDCLIWQTHKLYKYHVVYILKS